MKKFIVILCAFLALTALAGCSGSGNSQLNTKNTGLVTEIITETDKYLDGDMDGNELALYIVQAVPDLSYESGEHYTELSENLAHLLQHASENKKEEVKLLRNEIAETIGLDAKK